MNTRISRRIRSLLAIAVTCAQSAAAAPFAYITETGYGNVRVIDTATNATVATIPAGLTPTGVAINAAGTRVYITDSFGDNVHVIDAAANRVVAKIAVAAAPMGVTVDPAGARVYVANSGGSTPGDTVSVIDAATNVMIGTIRVGRAPFGVAVSPDGARLYVGNAADNTISVVDVAAQAATGTISLDRPPGGLAIDSSGTRLYATQSDPGSSSRGAVAVIDTATHAIVATIPVGVDPLGIDLNPAGTRAYVANSGTRNARGNTVSVIDTSALSVVATITVGDTPQGIAVHPSGSRVYVTSLGPDTVSVIDATNDTVAATIPVGVGPLSFGHFIGPDVAFTGNYQGLWWNSPAGSENGWGVNIAHQGDILFATWFTYGADGSGLWLVMSNGAKAGASTYSGALYRTTGSSFDEEPWNPSRIATARVGTATFNFADADHGTFTYTVGNVTQSKAITRQLFATPVPACAAGGERGSTPNFQDLWWRAPGGSESGWGLNITHQGDVLFATWFTYRADGTGQWLVMSNGARTGTASYSGTLFRTTGPAFDSIPWDAARVTRTAVGNATFTFTDANNGTFAYTLDGKWQVKPITRQVFASPPTVCK